MDFVFDHNFCIIAWSDLEFITKVHDTYIFECQCFLWNLASFLYELVDTEMEHSFTEICIF